MVIETIMYVCVCVCVCCCMVAVITVFIGVKIGEKSAIDERISHVAIFWILIGFMAFHCLVEVALTAHKLRVDIAAKGKSFDGCSVVLQTLPCSNHN